MAVNDTTLQQMWIEDKKKQAKERTKMILISAASIMAFFVIWQLVVTFELVDTRALPSPIDVFQTFLQKLSTKAPDGNTLTTNIFASLQVALLGFFSAIILGIPLGLIMGWYKGADKFFTPIFELVRPVPPIAWIPLIVLWMGIGLAGKALIIFFSAFVPCVINSYTGIKLTNETLINVSKTFGATSFEMFYKVGIPSSLPMVMAAVRLALSNSWTTLVAAEMLAATAGLGYMIQMGRQVARADIVVLGMLVIGIIGAILSTGLTKIENHLLRWKVKR